MYGAHLFLFLLIFIFLFLYVESDHKNNLRSQNIIHNMPSQSTMYRRKTTPLGYSACQELGYELIKNYVGIRILILKVGTTLPRGYGSPQNSIKIYAKITRITKNVIPVGRERLVNDEPRQYLIDNLGYRSRHERRCNSMSWHR